MTVAETKKIYAAEIDRLVGLRMTINDEPASQERQRNHKHGTDPRRNGMYVGCEVYISVD